MEIMDGKKLKDKILLDLKYQIEKLNKKPILSVIQIGDNDASNVYINQKKKMCDYIGYEFKHIKFNNHVNEEEIISTIKNLNIDRNINGILVQLPLPDNYNVDRILNTIHPDKDIDGLTDINAGKLLHNKDTLIPCTPLGIVTLLKEYKIDVRGKNVVIIGRSNLVGKPLCNLLINNDATVTICNSKTIDLKKHTINADIIVSATGKINLIKEDMVKENVIVIDVGITRDSNNKLHGDVDFEQVKNKSKFITPVPGGVGPMTIASLALNLLKANEIQKNQE